MGRKILNPLILLEASTRIELVYTDLQSAASPLRQLAVLWCRARDIPRSAGAQDVKNRQISPATIPDCAVAATHMICHEEGRIFERWSFARD